MSPAKPVYPWRLGATSFVFPADIASNVEQLAPLVDDVQLLFFESAARSRLAQPLDLELLRQRAGDFDLSFTVHLPLDIRLGHGEKSERDRGRAEILRLMERLEPLAPRCFDLHLPWETGLGLEQWQENLAVSLADLARDLGERTGLVAVENIDYPFSLVASLVVEQGFSFCLDMGHLLHYGHDDLGQAPALLARAGHVHCHGVCNGKDHQALHHRDQAVELGAWLVNAGYQGVVTLEMYSLESLTASLALLAEAWHVHGDSGGKKDDATGAIWEKTVDLEAGK